MMIRPIPLLLGWLLTVLIGGVVLASNTVPHDTPPVRFATERQIVLNFKEVDIRQLITFMSDLSGKTFLVDNAVRGKITLVGPTPLSRDEAYQVLLTALHSRGFTAIAQGNLVKIVPAHKAKASPLPSRP